MHSLRIIYMGSPEFAIPSLDLLHESQHRILAVVSSPDKRRKRGGKPVPTDLKKRALELGYPTIDAGDLRDPGFEKKIAELKPDLLVVVAFRILPASILNIPQKGSVNLHASLLPKYRGAAPIHWAVINGEKETGCSVFFLDEKIDTGKIISQSKIEIDPMETTGDVYAKLKQKGAELLLRSVNQIADNSASAIPQNHKLATPAPKLYKENAKIDFSRHASDLHNLVRGLNPFPVAWCDYNGQKMNVYRVRPAGDAETGHLSPGQMLEKNGRLYAGCGDNSVLELLLIQLPGTKRLSAQEFINGFDLSVNLK